MKASLENSLTDVFTEYDDSIFSDGSIDPLGLRMIWTSLGNRIFQNRLNTISTSIQFYTINLFHHSVIQQLEERYEEKIIAITGKLPYDNRKDLYDGIVIFLECLLSHIILKQEAVLADKPDLFIPGLSKLKGILLNRPADKIANSLPVSRNEGILVRHHLLGIHGRHKGPFQQMNLFSREEYYSDKPCWKAVRQLFGSAHWNKLFEALVQLIDQHILSAKPSASKRLWVALSDSFVQPLLPLYAKAFSLENFQETSLRNFWENRLGLADTQTTAGQIYQYVRQQKADTSFQDLVTSLAASADNEDLQAIQTIEPFISSVQKIMDRLLQRGTTVIDDQVRQLVKHQLNNPSIHTERIITYIIPLHFNEEAKKRLTELLDIYMRNTQPVNETGFVHELINFHKSIMEKRGNLAWITCNSSGAVTQNRSFYYTATASDFLENYKWANDYYLNTVTSLHKGLYQ